MRDLSLRSTNTIFYQEIEAFIRAGRGKLAAENRRRVRLGHEWVDQFTSRTLYVPFEILELNYFFTLTCSAFRISNSRRGYFRPTISVSARRILQSSNIDTSTSDTSNQLIASTSFPRNLHECRKIVCKRSRLPEEYRCYFPSTCTGTYFSFYSTTSNWRIKKYWAFVACGTLLSVDSRRDLDNIEKLMNILKARESRFAGAGRFMRVIFESFTQVL